MADIETLFTIQVTRDLALPYTEVRFRSVADHTHFLVLTSQGIRSEAPSNGNHVFCTSTQAFSPDERDNGRNVYHLISFRGSTRGGSSTPLILTPGICVVQAVVALAKVGEAWVK